MWHEIVCIASGTAPRKWKSSINAFTLSGGSGGGCGNGGVEGVGGSVVVVVVMEVLNVWWWR